MIIDWYTIVFQIINFMILVFLLRHFLYGPIVEAMDEREEKIVSREKDAALREKEAMEESRTYQRKTQGLRERTEEIMQEARIAAEERKREMLQEARSTVERTRELWEEDFERERDIFVRELRKRVAQQASTIARRCLLDLADADLEDLAWEQFLVEIDSLSEDSLGRFRDAVVCDDHVIILRSAFGIEEDRLEDLVAKLKKLLPGVNGRFRLIDDVDADLICGLELQSGGHRLGWSIDDYLNGLEERILQEMFEPRPEVKEVDDGAIEE